MPVFGSGHARVKFGEALTAMRSVLTSAETAVEQVAIVIYDPDRADDARTLLS